MADEVTLPLKKYNLGEVKKYRVQLQEEDSADLSDGAATFEVWDSAGVNTLPADDMVIVGTKRARLEYLLDSTAQLVDAGDYTAVTRFTRGSDVRIWKGPLRVVAVP